MTERNQFTPYGQNPYQQQYSASPQAAQEERIGLRPRNRGLLEKVFGMELSSKMKTPLFATVALFAVGAAFAGVIAISYPDSGDVSNVPVLKAETMAFKEAPTEAGGMDVPYQDSTVFNVTRASDAVENPFSSERPIENLLEDPAPTEEPVDMAAAFADEAADAAAAAEKAKAEAEAIKNEVVAAAEASTEEKAARTVESLTDLPKATKVETIAQTQEKIAPQDLMKKVETPAPAAVATTTQAAANKQPDKLHAAGSSPETLAFVRSVLDQKDTKGTATKSEQVAQAQAANIAATMNRLEPAAGGNAINAPSITPGSHYVQLGSVTSSTGADAEWGKMQKSLPLAGLSHRVQEANLGDRGTFYRIQAGPMSKDSANRLCDQIKAQKPGGCLVVK